MVKINFYLRDFKENKPQSIWIVFSFEGTRTRINSFQSILPKNWSTDKQKVLSGEKNSDGINQLLKEQENFISDYLSALKFKKKRFYKDVLQNEFNSHFKVGEVKTKEGEVSDFISFIDKYIDNRKELTLTTLQTLQVTKRNIIQAFGLITDKDMKQWEKMSFREKKFNPDFLKPNKPMDFDEINRNWMAKFNAWCLDATFKTNKTGEEKKEKYSKNYIAKQIAIAKRFCNAAADDGLINNLSYKSIKASWEDSDTVHLNWEEIERLKGLKLAPESIEGKVRNLFVFNCYCGLRFSDLRRLDKSRFTTQNNQLYLKIRMQKTDDLIHFPILPSAEKIMQIYDYKLPEISELAYNDTIKKLAFDADITQTEHKRETRGGKKTVITKLKFEMISSHTGRRSFATNFYGDNVPVNQLMLVTGHTTEKSFMKYVKKKAESHFRDFITIGANR